MNSDGDASPPAGSSSHFPPNYLNLLQGLPLPERYLINTPALLGQDQATYTEISIPTQTNSIMGEGGGVPVRGPGGHRRQDSKNDDDTDLDASDFEDEEVDEEKIGRRGIAVSGHAGKLWGVMKTFSVTWRVKWLCHKFK